MQRTRVRGSGVTYAWIILPFFPRTPGRGALVHAADPRAADGGVRPGRGQDRGVLAVVGPVRHEGAGGRHAGRHRLDRAVETEPRDNEPWWRAIKERSAEFKAYYEKQYGAETDRFVNPGEELVQTAES